MTAGLPPLDDARERADDIARFKRLAPDLHKAMALKVAAPVVCERCHCSIPVGQFCSACEARSRKPVATARKPVASAASEAPAARGKAKRKPPQPDGQDVLDYQKAVLQPLRGQLAYDVPTQVWYERSGQHWDPIRTDAETVLWVRIADGALEAVEPFWKVNSQKTARFLSGIASRRGEGQAVLDLARLRLAAEFSDKRRSQVPLANGLFDARTGELRPYRDSEYFAAGSVVPVTLEAGHIEAISLGFGPALQRYQTWASRLDRAFKSDREVMAYLFRWLAARALLGREGERFVLLLGIAGSGKTTLAAWLSGVFGPTALKAKRNVFTPRSDHNRPLADTIRLNPRLATVEEIGGRKALTSLVKDVCGGDKSEIEARVPYGRDCVRGPIEAAWILVGERPPSVDWDGGIQRRVLPVRFDSVIPRAERQSRVQRLTAENPQERAGLFVLLAAAALDYMRDGMGAEPARIRGWRSELVAECNPVGSWIRRHKVAIDGRTMGDIMHHARENPDDLWHVTGGECENARWYDGSTMTSHKLGRALRLEGMRVCREWQEGKVVRLWKFREPDASDASEPTFAKARRRLQSS